MTTLKDALNQAESDLDTRIQGIRTLLVQVLEGDNAVLKNREIMGATFPKDAKPGTIRADFCDAAGDQGENAVHGSDSAENAANEIAFFFSPEEIHPRTR